VLDDNTKQDMDTDFQDIFNLGCEKGIKAIIDEAQFHDPSGLKAFNEWMSEKKSLRQGLFCLSGLPRLFGRVPRCFFMPIIWAIGANGRICRK
jgi:hypothetical protein